MDIDQTVGIREAHAGLALATTLSSALNAYLLYHGLRRVGVYRPRAGWFGIWTRVTLAAGLMAGLLLLGVGDITAWLVLSGWERIGSLTFWILTSAILYFLMLYITGIRLHHFRSG